MLPDQNIVVCRVPMEERSTVMNRVEELQMQTLTEALASLSHANIWSTCTSFIDCLMQLLCTEFLQRFTSLSLISHSFSLHPPYKQAISVCFTFQGGTTNSLINTTVCILSHKAPESVPREHKFMFWDQLKEFSRCAGLGLSCTICSAFKIQVFYIIQVFKIQVFIGILG